MHAGAFWGRWTMSPDRRGGDGNHLLHMLLSASSAGAGLGVLPQRQGGRQPHRKPSLLLVNFSSCFLGTSYLEERRRETLKASRWGALLPGLLLRRHQVCVCFLRIPADISRGHSGRFPNQSPASVSPTIQGLTGGHTPPTTRPLSLPLVEKLQRQEDHLAFLALWLPATGLSQVLVIPLPARSARLHPQSCGKKRWTSFSPQDQKRPWKFMREKEMTTGALGRGALRRGHEREASLQKGQED